MPLPAFFDLKDFEQSLEVILHVEVTRYRRAYTERLVQLYKHARLR